MPTLPDHFRKLVIHELTGDFRTSTSVTTQAWVDPGAGQVAIRNRWAGCNAIFDKNLCRNRIRYVDVRPPYDMGIESVGEIVACLGRAPPGVEFDSMDGQPTYLFFVLVAPESSTGAHLKALARISRVFKDPEFRKRLLAAPDAEAMYHVVADEDAKY